MNAKEIIFIFSKPEFGGFVFGKPEPLRMSFSQVIRGVAKDKLSVMEIMFAGPFNEKATKVTFQIGLPDNKKLIQEQARLACIFLELLAPEPTGPDKNKYLGTVLPAIKTTRSVPFEKRPVKKEQWGNVHFTFTHLVELEQLQIVATQD